MTVPLRFRFHPNFFFLKIRVFRDGVWTVDFSWRTYCSPYARLRAGVLISSPINVNLSMTVQGARRKQDVVSWGKGFPALTFTNLGFHLGPL